MEEPTFVSYAVGATIMLIGVVLPLATMFIRHKKAFQKQTV